MPTTKIYIPGCVDGAAQNTPVYLGVTEISTGIVALASSAASNLATNITTATTTLIKTGAGVLDSVIVNSLGTVASTVKIYDGVNASGTLKATLNSLAVLGAVKYGFAFTTGLCIVTTGTVAPDVTVVYS